MDLAFANGCEALALTDHGNMNGFAYQVLHAKKMKKQGKDFKPIFGVEAYFIPSVPEWKEQLEELKKDKKKAKSIDADRAGTNIEADGESKGKSMSDINRTRHLVLIAMNQTGLNNIFKMVSESYHGDYYYRKPRIDYALLEEYNEGVIALSACLGGVYAGCYRENRDEGSEAVLNCMREVTKQFQAVLGDRWYAELQWNNIPEQHELNQYIIQVAGEMNVKLISTCDSHYQTTDAWQSRELYKRLGWRGRKPEWASMERPLSTEESGYELYPKNGDEMWEAYKKDSADCGAEYDDDLVLRSIEGTHCIAFVRIENFLPDNTVRLPSFVVPAGHTATEALINFSLEGLRKMGLADNKEYLARLKSELKVIDDADSSILSNITKVKMYKFITPTLNSALKYTISFNNAFYNPHSGHNSGAGGIVSSTGFKINDDSSTNEHFLDDDGAGNIRVYYLSGTTRIYTNSTYGTVDYTTGEIILTSSHITSISNVDGAASTRIRVTVTPDSNDIIPVRNQTLEIDTSNSSFTGSVDEIESGSSQAGTGYTTTSSY